MEVNDVLITTIGGIILSIVTAYLGRAKAHAERSSIDAAKEQTMIDTITSGSRSLIDQYRQTLEEEQEISKRYRLSASTTREELAACSKTLKIQAERILKLEMGFNILYHQIKKEQGNGGMPPKVNLEVVSESTIHYLKGIFRDTSAHG